MGTFAMIILALLALSPLIASLIFGALLIAGPFETANEPQLKVVESKEPEMKKAA